MKGCRRTHCHNELRNKLARLAPAVDEQEGGSAGLPRSPSTCELSEFTDEGRERLAERGSVAISCRGRGWFRRGQARLASWMFAYAHQIDVSSNPRPDF